MLFMSQTFLRHFQINHLFNGSFATLYKQAGREKLTFKLVNYSVYYPAKTVLQDCARKTSKNLALKMSFSCKVLSSFLSRQSYTCKILARSCMCKESGRKCLFSCTDLAISWVCLLPICIFPSLTRFKH